MNTSGVKTTVNSPAGPGAPLRPVSATPATDRLRRTEPLDPVAGQLACVRPPVPAGRPPVPAGRPPVPAARPRRAVRPGTDIGPGTELGNYRLLSCIGEGGMGRVFLAEHLRIRRRVAIKVLRPELVARRRAVARLYQEAMVVNQIRHRNIVDITDFVELPDGTTFVVMEYLTGSCLQQHLQLVGRMAPVAAIEIALAVCDALEATHALGVIHRDLKPGNIFLCEPETSDVAVKLLDFGIAKLHPARVEVTGSSAIQTRCGVVLGTPAYMSPEQSRGEALDGRSDIYALGAILYELLCGEPAAPAATGIMPPVGRARERTIAAGERIPPVLAALVARCLEPRRELRPPDVAALRNELARVRAELTRGPLWARLWHQQPVLGLMLGAVLAGLLAGRVSAGRAGDADVATLQPVIHALERSAAPARSAALAPRWQPGAPPGGNAATAPLRPALLRWPAAAAELPPAAGGVVAPERSPVPGWRAREAPTAAAQAAPTAPRSGERLAAVAVPGGGARAREAAGPDPQGRRPAARVAARLRVNGEPAAERSARARQAGPRAARRRASNAAKSQVGSADQRGGRRAADRLLDPFRGR
jgi:serine/threonine-protein kinase